MALIGIEVEVSRNQYSAVILLVDDEDVRFKDAIGKVGLWDAVAPFVEPAITTTLDCSRHSWDWEAEPGEDGFEVQGVKIIAEREARQFKFFEVGYAGPTPAEVKAAREAAGQIALALPPDPQEALPL